MTTVALYTFWTGIVIVLYTYVGYGIVIYVLSKLIGRPHLPSPSGNNDLPAVTMLIAAYNEEGYIEEKIRNTMAIDYPPEKFIIIVVTDGSTDRTPELVRQYPDVRLYHEAGRKGKIHAVNRVMKMVTTPIVIFSDANTFVNPEAVRNMVRHYEDPVVGGVAGEKRIFVKKEDNASGAGEGLYWKYESFLKKMDSRVYSVVGAAGELFSVRTDLFEEPGENMIIEDFVMSLKIAMKGYRFIYEPEACAMENATASVSEEWKRKVRISAGGFQSIITLKRLLNPFRYGILFFQYFSHRVLRWTLAPLFLPLILISNFILAWQGPMIYRVLLVLQIAFYAVAFLGQLFRDRKISIKGFFVPYYFSVMNVSVYFGFFRYFRGRQSVMWEKAARAK